MGAKKPSLGRNLDALLGSIQPVVKTPAINTLPVDMIQGGKYQPRKDMDPDALQELAASIKAQGIIQPIVVRKIANDRYEIIAGERRWRAAQLAEMEDVPVILRDISDESALVLALIENIQREDLNAIEEARALKRLLEEFSLTHQQVADAVGKSRTAVSNLLRLLSLHEGVIRLLEYGDLDMGHARSLLSLEQNKQLAIAKEIVAKGYTVRETERLIRKSQMPPSPATHPTQKDPNIRTLENKLAETLGAKVIIQHTAQGKGKLVIHYHSVDELDGIIEHISAD